MNQVVMSVAVVVPTSAAQAPGTLALLVLVASLVASPQARAPAVGLPPCEVVCSDVSIDEPGACGEEVDGGCGSVPLPWIPANPGDVFCGRAWADGGVRDTDFYLLCVEDPDGDGVAQLCGTLISEFPGVCFIVDGISTGECDPVECDPVIVGQIGCGSECGNIAVASACVPAPGDYVVFVAPGNCDGTGIFNGYPCGTSNDYQLCITVTNACDQPCGECVTGGKCPWDLNGDGNVNVVDLLQLIASWGPCADCPADFNGDEIVNVVDLLALIANGGPCPGAPCVWDVNGDGVVDQSDLHQVLDNMGPCDGCAEDVNGDGFVNGQDAAAVATHFGPCP
jgi:hypothetical protein